MGIGNLLIRNICELPLSLVNTTYYIKDKHPIKFAKIEQLDNTIKVLNKLIILLS